MRSSTRPPKHKMWKTIWHRRFAWFPRRVCVSPELTPDTHKPAWCWVWLEYYQTRKELNNYWEKRTLGGANEQDQTTTEVAD